MCLADAAVAFDYRSPICSDMCVCVQMATIAVWLSFHIHSFLQLSDWVCWFLIPVPQSVWSQVSDSLASLNEMCNHLFWWCTSTWDSQCDSLSHEIPPVKESAHEQSITAGELHLIPFYPILVWYFNWIWLDSNEWTHFEWNCLHKHTYLILSRSSKKEKERVNGVQPSIFNQRALTHFNYIDTRSSSFFWCFKLHYCLLCLCSMWTLFFLFCSPSDTMILCVCRYVIQLHCM